MAVEQQENHGLKYHHHLEKVQQHLCLPALQKLCFGVGTCVMPMEMHIHSGIDAHSSHYPCMYVFCMGKVKTDLKCHVLY